jgi:hypothetical protein
MNAPYPEHKSEKADDNLTSSGSTDTSSLRDRGCATEVASYRKGVRNSTGTGKTAVLDTADLLSLAAAPTFALMALLVRASPESSPLSGMVLMYVLMAAFESVHWLKLISNRRSGGRRG